MTSIRRLIPTAHITTGPFFPSQFIRPEDSDLTRGRRAPGPFVSLGGMVLDADGTPCVNAIIEIWQADGSGSFGLWGRTWTDKAGRYRFLTVKPGPVSGGHDRPRPPYVNVMLHASGLMRPLVTQLFFPGERLNETDPQLSLVSPDRRARLVAQPWRDPDAPLGVVALRFDIALSGPNETPFFED